MKTEFLKIEIKSWVEKYSDELYSWASYKTSSKEIAEDLVQDTFLAAIKSYDGFHHKSNPKTWLFAILNNKINDYYRSQIKNQGSYSIENLKDSDVSPFDESESWKRTKTPGNWEIENDTHLLDDEHFRKTLEDCLNELPRNWSLAVKMKYLSDKDAKIICQELNITTSNYWQIIHRAKLQLRECIEFNWFQN